MRFRPRVSALTKSTPDSRRASACPRPCAITRPNLHTAVRRSPIVRILDHLGEPSRAPRMAPIRSPPCAGEWWDGDDIGDCRSLAFDPPVDVMPDDENQRQDVIG